MGARPARGQWPLAPQAHLFVGHGSAMMLTLGVVAAAGPPRRICRRGTVAKMVNVVAGSTGSAAGRSLGGGMLPIGEIRPISTGSARQMSDGQATEGTEKAWGGRFADVPDARLEAYNASVGFDV